MKIIMTIRYEYNYNNNINNDNNNNDNANDNENVNNNFLWHPGLLVFGFGHAMWIMWFVSKGYHINT